VTILWENDQAFCLKDTDRFPANLMAEFLDMKQDATTICSGPKISKIPVGDTRYEEKSIKYERGEALFRAIDDYVVTKDEHGGVEVKIEVTSRRYYYENENVKVEGLCLHIRYEKPNRGVLEAREGEDEVMQSIEQEDSVAKLEQGEDGV
jgi:hypothetical protein